MVGPKPPIGFSPSKPSCGKSTPLLLVLRAISSLIKVRLTPQPRGFLCLDELDLRGRGALEGLSLFDTNDNRATYGS